MKKRKTGNHTQERTPNITHLGLWPTFRSDKENLLTNIENTKMMLRQSH